MEELKLLHQYASEARGLFISQTAFIEKKMEYFIAFYFCRDKGRAEEMIDLLTGDRFVSFESKRDCFQNILSRHYKDIYKANSEKFEMLTTIQKERNRFAHLMIDVNEQRAVEWINTGTFYLLKFTKDRKPVAYTVQHLKKIMTMVDDVADWVDSLLVAHKTPKPPRT